MFLADIVPGNGEPEELETAEPENSNADEGEDLEDPYAVRDDFIPDLADVLQDDDDYVPKGTSELNGYF